MKIVESVINSAWIGHAPSDEKAKILCRRTREDDGALLEMQWLGPKQLPACATFALLEQMIGSSVNTVGEAEVAVFLFPWPMRILGPHPTSPDAVLVRRLDVS